VSRRLGKIQVKRVAVPRGSRSDPGPASSRDLGDTTPGAGAMDGPRREILEVLEGLPKEIRDLGRLIAFRVLEFRDTFKALGFQGNEGQSLYRLLLGRSGTSNERLAKIQELVSQYGELLPEQECKFGFGRRELVHGMPAQSSFGEDGHGAPKLPVATDAIVRLTNREVVETFSHMALAMLPLAECIDSEKFSSAERAHLREMTKGDGIFRLSTLLNRLCSERARKHFDSVATGVKGGVA